MTGRKWDDKFLGLAREVSTWSKDPSTKVGAVIVDANCRVVSLGYNGFPSYIEDTEERLNNRELKLRYTVHAEINAILQARQSVKGCTLYTVPFMPCANCALQVIQAGIDVVIAPEATPEQEARWGESFKLTRALFEEAGVEFATYPIA
jgi:dCMP deaminase